MTPHDEPTVRTIAAAHAPPPGGLLPALHAVQDALGHVPDDAVPLLADAFNLSRAEVHGVLTFYADFRRAPPGCHVLRVCRAEACQACGGETLAAQAEALLGCASGETRGDGAVTLQAVHCLGLCASAPAVQLDERLHARVTPQRLAQLLAPLLAPLTAGVPS
jgi:formate dehydrogenase subunit gamma